MMFSKAIFIELTGTFSTNNGSVGIKYTVEIQGSGEVRNCATFLKDGQTPDEAMAVVEAEIAAIHADTATVANVWDDFMMFGEVADQKIETATHSGDCFF